jgi:predicted transcriptional regulator
MRQKPIKVLLSIKPEFAEKIFNGSKKFEYRRSIFKNSDVKTIVVYASSPLKKVIGEFDIDHILLDDINNLWLKTQHLSGIDEEYFFNYFSDKRQGYAIAIKRTRVYRKPLSLKNNFNVLPPQSFAYLFEE